MDALALIRAYLDYNSSNGRHYLYPDSVESRSGLLTFVKDRVPSEQVELAVDCLIAAGLGREQEQNGTVYCRCSY
jgi:hypothetical protein